MEIEELKSLWQADSQRLEKRIELNEQLLQQMNMEKAMGKFDELVQKSIMGRNMALVYGVISIVCASLVIEKLELSIPIILAAFAMFWSFKYHLVIEKPGDYSKVSLVALQKSICKFRIHTSSSAKYDISIFLLWALTLIPLSLDAVLKVSVYSSLNYAFPFAVFVVAVAIILPQMFKTVYQEYETTLKESELYLEEIIEFEKA